MPDTILNALRQKLERYEAAGMPDEVKRVKARIALEEKAEKGEASKLAMTLAEPPPGPAVLGATVTTTSTVKKAAAPKKSGARKSK